jgi:hypothetical protein
MCRELDVPCGLANSSWFAEKGVRLPVSATARKPHCSIDWSSKSIRCLGITYWPALSLTLPGR